MLLLYVRLQYQSRDRNGVRSPALQQNQRPQSRVEGWVAQEEGSVASASQARAPSAAGPLKQQYQAAVAFLQEIFSKVRTVGYTAHSKQTKFNNLTGGSCSKYTWMQLPFCNLSCPGHDLSSGQVLECLDS